MKENDYISREEVISHLEYCLANFTDYKKALEETLDKVKHTRVISLPKGHGRLIDADNITFSEFFDAGDYAQAMRGIYNSPTIIEADKESD